MTIEENVADLTTATTELLAAVVNKELILDVAVARVESMYDDLIDGGTGLGLTSDEAIAYAIAFG